VLTHLYHMILGRMCSTFPPPQPVVLRPNAGHGLLILGVFRSHTTHHIWWDSSGQVISSSQRPLPDNTQHSQQTDIHAPDGIQIHNISRRVAVELHLRPRGHWDRRAVNLYSKIVSFMVAPILESAQRYTIILRWYSVAVLGKNFTAKICGRNTHRNCGHLIRSCF